MNFQFFSEFIERLGLMGFPLLATSIIALAVVLERLVFFWKARPEALKIRRRFDAHYSGESVELNVRSLADEPSPLAQMVRQYYSGGPQVPEEKRRRAAEVAISGWVTHARGGIRHLSVLAQVAPLLGLTGTVLGLVEAFRVIEASERMANPALLAGGIWEALLTTVVGMLISIPLMFAIRLFNQRVELTVNAARELFVHIEQRTSGQPLAKAPTPALAKEDAA